ncbi:MAG: hypothetical protein LBL90_12920 [Prevotellaceae bacterium]|jgi:hypothetical protein|nr:hypothetical protein [Prevotellaceae bacterium]
MKKFILYIFAITFISGSFLSCEDKLEYDGPAMCKFPANNSAIFFVQDKPDASYEVTIQLVGTPQNNDVTLGIVADATSTAKAGVDYNMPATVVIPKGSNLGTFTVTGIYNGIADVDSKKLVIKLEGNSEIKATTTVNTYTLTMQKYCPFIKSDFIGTWSVDDVSGYDGPYPTYNIVVSEGQGDTLIVTGLWGEVMPVKIVLTEPSVAVFALFIPKQDYFWADAYGQAWIEEYNTAGTYDPCEMTISTNYKVYVNAGYYDQVTSSKWKKVSTSTEPVQLSVIKKRGFSSKPLM